MHRWCIDGTERREVTTAAQMSLNIVAQDDLALGSLAVLSHAIAQDDMALASEQLAQANPFGLRHHTILKTLH